MTRPRAVALVEALLRENYPKADLAFVAGSIMRGAGNPSSDLDLVVVHPQLPDVRQECFIYDGVRVEAFVQDWETLDWCLDAERDRGVPLFVNVLSEGYIAGPRPWLGEAAQHRARQARTSGPRPLSRSRLDELRFLISDLVDDLRAPLAEDEILATGANLYEPLADLALRGAQAWSGGACKWTARRLRDLDPALGQRFAAAFQTLFRAYDPEDVVALAEEVLGRHGGPLTDGYSRVAFARGTDGG